jgi:serine/threonine protein kinase
MEPQRIGPYLIQQELGAGGMGTVYLGRHVDTGAEAAVKLLPPELARQEGFVLRFSREIEALRKLNSPHIVQLFDSGEDLGSYYFAMEYVAGDNLAQLLRREKRLPWREAVEIATQLCSALKAAHDAGIVHRDLKPSNILLSTDGQVKLTDFGVAQLFTGEKLTITGGIVGTVEYMSPEQALGHRATKRSDLYSLGAVLYALLTGRPPFVGNTAVDILQKHRFSQFDLPSSYVPEIPHWLDEVVSQLLEKDPDKRLPDAFVLSRRLQEVVNKVALRDGGGGDMTVIGPAGDLPTGTTAAAPFEGPGEATLMRNLVRDEILRGEPATWWQKLLDNTYILVGLLLVLVGGVWALQSWRTSPEQHLAAAKRLLDSPPGNDWLTARDEHLRPLMDGDPARWRDEVEPLLEEIDLYELERRLTPSRKRGRKGSPPTEPERLLADVRRLWDQGQLVEAQRKLTATQRLLDGEANAEELAKLAERWAEALSAAREEQSPVEFVRAIMARAQKMEQTNPDAARDLWHSVVELYEHDPSVAVDVEAARQRLQRGTVDR